MSQIPLFQTEDTVPTELGELAYTGCDIYDDPRLGVKLRYDRGMTKADVYLYDLGINPISEDVRSEQVMEFFQQSCNDILVAAERGIYNDLETRTSQYLHIPDNSPDPMYLWAAFYYRQAPAPGVVDEGYRYSHILIRTDGGYINKVRYTYPERVKNDASRDMIQFLLDWDAALRGR